MNTKADIAREYWNSDSIVNEFTNAAFPEYWKEFFVKYERPEDLTVLDLGCGGGRNTYMLANLGFHVEACDLHEKMLQATKHKIAQLDKKRKNNVRIQYANMLDLPFQDESIDIVLSNGVYHNNSSIADFEKAIKETARVLKQQGLLCVNVFTNRFIDESLIKQKQDALYITPDNLDMILLSEKRICELLKKQDLYPDGETFSYCSKINVGVRSVFRGIFKKGNIS